MVLTVNISRFWDGAQWRTAHGQDRRVYLSLHENAWPFTEEKLKSLEFNGDFEDPKFSSTAYTEGIELTCKEETFNGKTTERWELAHWGKQIKPAAADVTHRLNARWNASTGSSKPVASATSPPPPLASTDGPYTKQTAWDKLCETWEGNKTEEERTAMWNNLVAECGKPESDFTREDWQTVQEAAEVPY